MSFEEEVHKEITDLVAATTVLHCAAEMFLDAAEAFGDPASISAGQAVLDLVAPLVRKRPSCLT